MDPQVALQSALEAFADGTLPPEEVVTAVLEDNAARQQLLAHPALAAALARRAAGRSGMACTAVEDGLAAFIDAEKHGGEALTSYRGLSLHLRQCPWCFEEYRAASDIIAAQMTGLLPSWPRHAPDAPSPAAGPHRSSIILPRPELHRSLFTWRAQAAITRGPLGAESRQLLYAGAVPGHPDLFARITLVRPADLNIDAWQIWVALEGPKQLAELPIILRFGAEVREERTDARGEARFSNIPASWISAEEAPDLLVAVGTA